MENPSAITFANTYLLGEKSIDDQHRKLTKTIW